MHLRVSFLMVAALLSSALVLGCAKKPGTDNAEVTGIDPALGHIRGEQTVRILGKHFRTDIGYTVYFGSAKARNVSVLNSSTILVSTPAGDKPGPVDVWVRSDDGPEFRINKGFKYADLSGSVIEKLGSPEKSQTEKPASKLAY